VSSAPRQPQERLITDEEGKRWVFQPETGELSPWVDGEVIEDENGHTWVFQPETGELRCTTPGVQSAGARFGVVAALAIAAAVVGVIYGLVS
jgi:hypothetical protein